MADSKITGLTALTSVASTDLVEVVDVSDTSMAATGTNKQATVANVATAVSSALGLGSMATQASSNVSITGGSVSGITDLAVADGGTGASDAATARTNLGLAIGTNVQAYDPDLAAIAGVTSAADQVPYFTGSGTASTMTVTAAARTVLDDTTTAAMLTTLGGISGIRVEDEGVSTVATATALNFVGSSVTVTDAGSGEATVTITGGGAVATDTIWDAKGDLAVGTGANTASRLAIGADGTSATADSSASTGVKWGYRQLPRLGASSGDWISPSFISTPTDAAWPIINRAYFTPLLLDEDTTITAVGFKISTTGAAGTVIRVGIFAGDAARRGPGTLIVDAGTVANDSTTGMKTITLGASQALERGRLYWLAAAPQGSGAAGSAWMSTGVIGGGWGYMAESGASFAGSIYGLTAQVVPYASISGAFSSNPSLTWEGHPTNRYPYIAVRSA